MAKLSKRELAAKKSGGSLNYKTGKITVAPKVMAKPAPFKGAGFSGTKSMAELGGMSPGMIAYQQQQENAYQASPQAKQDTLTHTVKSKQIAGGGSKMTDTDRRKMAAQAANIKNKGFDLNAGLESGGLTMNKPIAQRPATLGQGGSTFMGNLKNKALGGIMDIFSNVGDYQKQIAGNGTPAEGLRDMSQFAYDNTLDVPGVNAANKLDLPASGSQYQADVAAAFGRPQPGTDLESAFRSGGITENVQENGPSNPFGVPTAQAKDNPTGDNNDNGSSETVVDPPNPYALTAEEFAKFNNEKNGGGPGPVDTPPPSVNPPRKMGAYGTGKGLMNDDPYIKELRKAYSSNGGEKWLRKQFEELIAALDPTYAQMQKEGQDALQAQLLNNNNQLASVMNANNTGDSEQRAQLMAGQQRDSQTALGNLLAKLSQAKAQDVSGYRSKMAESMANLQDKNQTNKQRLLEQIQQYKQQQLVNSRSGSGAKKNTNLIALMEKAANMSSGGAQWAKNNAATYGVDPNELNLTGNWGDGYRAEPEAVKPTAPQRSTNPMPEEQDDGTVIDGNPYSPTYGMEMVQA